VTLKTSAAMPTHMFHSNTLTTYRDITLHKIRVNGQQTMRTD